MIRTVRQTVARCGMVSPGDRILVAVSGGADSVALLRVLQILAPEWRLFLAAAHLNHGLRGTESDREETFVRRICECLAVPCESGRLEGGSAQSRRGARSEAMLRQKRYCFLEEVAAARQVHRIALGHHREDNVETVLMHLLRGTGPDGLGGIPPVRDGRFIRPLIDVTKRQIHSFLEREGLPWVEDSSNREPVYFRNRVRRNVLSVLRDADPRLDEHVHRAGRLIRQESDFIQSAALEVLSSWGVHLGKAPIRLDLVAFASLHEALRARVARIALASLSPAGGGIGYAHVAALLALAGRRKGGGECSLPFGIRVRRSDVELVIERGTEGRGAGKDGARDVPAVDVPVPGIVASPVGSRTFRCRIADPGSVPWPADPEQRVYLDQDRIVQPLAIRAVRPGDRIQPLGMAGSKKMQDLFTDAKVARTRRKEIPLFVDGASVVCVWGIRLSERVKVKDDTRRILVIETI